MTTSQYIKIIFKVLLPNLLTMWIIPSLSFLKSNRNIHVLAFYTSGFYCKAL